VETLFQRSIFDEEHDAFRDVVRAFVDNEIAPHHEQWEKDSIVPREIWEKAGATGLLCTDVPPEYGGGGIPDFRYNAIVGEELGRVNASGIGFGLHNDIVVPYLLRIANEEQKQRWFPKMASGAAITAIAMTEPATGSDLAGIQTTATRQSDGSYLVNGAKTFITNGINADLVITAVKTDPSKRHEGMSLLVIERGMEGFERGRNLNKVGLKAQDTAELFFTDVRVPPENLLGEEGLGFKYLVENLAQERLSVAVGVTATGEAAVEWTLDYIKGRTAFGKPIGSFQNSKFLWAEMATKMAVCREFVDRCLMEHVAEGKELSAEQAAMAKYWATETVNDVVDKGVQLHGGYGFMWEYPIARAFADMRVTSIYAGTNEIMKEIIGRHYGL
jgi:alkylation response protein AidB-like acyl-CoA dehydrogenase